MVAHVAYGDLADAALEVLDGGGQGMGRIDKSRRPVTLPADADLRRRFLGKRQPVGMRWGAGRRKAATPRLSSRERAMTSLRHSALARSSSLPWVSMRFGDVAADAENADHPAWRRAAAICWCHPARPARRVVVGSTWLRTASLRSKTGILLRCRCGRCLRKHTVVFDHLRQWRRPVISARAGCRNGNATPSRSR